MGHSSRKSTKTYFGIAEVGGNTEWIVENGSYKYSLMSVLQKQAYFVKNMFMHIQNLVSKYLCFHYSVSLYNVTSFEIISGYYI